MGSPISAIISESLNKSNSSIPFYYRYVDDTVLFVPNDKIHDTLNVFNSYHPRLQFTFEREQNNSITFLDIKIIKNDDGTLKTNWFHKEAYAGRFFNFLSNHPYQHKFAMIRNLVDTALLLSDKSFHVQNIEIIKKI